MRGRGGQAEVAVTLNLPQLLRTWLRSDDQRYDAFTQTIRELSEEQQSVAYRWHTKTEWEGNLIPPLVNPSRAVQRQFTDYRSLLGEGMHLDDLAQ